ncbi:MAG: PKD domain-containing protein [Acidobacteriota bacterium]
MFFNQQGTDEHIDINSVRNVVVQDNVFFNQIPGNLNDTSSFIIMKDSNDTQDSILGVHDVTLRRNVFLNYEGSTGTGFVGVGEDGMPYYEGYNITLENNLMLGNAANLMRSAFAVKGGRDIVFRNNTVVGDLPSRSYALRLIQEGSNPQNDNVRCYNNVWSDPSGTMGSEAYTGVDFAESPPAQNMNTMVLGTNLYWNGAQPIPPDPTELVNYTDDATRIVADPILPGQSGLVVPYWNGTTFADGSSSIAEAFQRLVTLYGQPGAGSPAIDAADPTQAPADDILGNPRGASPDVGCVETGAGGPTADFSGTPRSGPAPLAVTFTDLSTGSITAWSWTFGDGGTSAVQNPSHAYLAPGSYDVALAVTGPGGSDTRTKLGYITVTGSAPIENFVSGRGRALPDPNDVAIHSLGGVQEASFVAYASGQWGTLVASGDVDGSSLENPLTGPGPGPSYGPQVRAWQVTGTPVAKVNFYAYGTLRYGVNPASGALDADAPWELLSGAGPGAVFGPHVRGWNYDGVALTAIAKISFFAYGTLKYGVDAGSSDVDDDGYSEILTGPGPSNAFGPQVRGFDYDGASISAISKINFNAFAGGGFGCNPGGGDADGDAYGEIVAGRGPGPSLSEDVAGFDYDGASITALAGYGVTLGSALYGARGSCGDIDGDGQGELVAGAGESPSASPTVQSYDYSGSALTAIGTGTFNAFSGSYGVIPASGVFGY